MQLLKWFRTGCERPAWILLLLPLFIQLPALLGYYNPDPMYFTGNIGGHAEVVHMGIPWADPNVGYQGQALGKLSADLWLSGQVPWWNAYNGVGLPLAAEVQPGSLFLPFVLLYHFRDGGAWVELILQIIAGLSSFALLRKLKLAEIAALAGALLFEFNGTFAWHGAPIITPVAFLPMLLLGVEQLFERIKEGGVGGWLLIPLALAWSIYAGFPETAYIDGLLVSVWVLVRVCDLSRHQQLIFVGKLGFAVFIALLCSFPLLLPFAEYLTRSYLGGHDGAGGFVHAALPVPGFAVSLMPWLYGPIAGYSGSAVALLKTWGGVGGYFTALQVALAILGVMLVPRKLNLALLIWLLICLGKTFDLRPISDLVNLLPMIKSAAFFRYAPPSWEFAGSVLVAMTIDGLLRHVPLSNKRLLFVFILSLALAGGGVWLARDTVQALLLSAPGYRHYLYPACVWLVCSLFIGFSLIAMRGRLQNYACLLVMLLGIDACMAFSLPLHSGASNVHYDKSGVAFLQANIGLQRLYSLGPLAPNYGGYFQIAQINHNYLPVSRDWIDYIHQHLDPYAHFVTFVGEGWRTDHLHKVAEELRIRRAAYEQLGVKYVLAPHGVNPFVDVLSTDVNGDAQPLALHNGQDVVLHWQLSPSQQIRRIDRLDVLIGNYGGHADGLLSGEVCADQGVCAKGEQELRDSVDNAPLQIALDRVLLLPAGSSTALTITLSQKESSSPVALWVSPIDMTSPQPLTVIGGPSGFAPELDLQLVPTNSEAGVRQVYSQNDMDIYELPGAKPYFEINGGPCTLQIVSRLEVVSDCQGPAHLLRREAYYPGWRADINGELVPIVRAAELFQQTDLMAGKQDVVFFYRPSYYVFILVGFLIGIAVLLYVAWRDLMVRRLR